MSCSKIWVKIITKMALKEKYQGADKSLARPGRKQARKHVMDAWDFNNIETRAVIKFFFFLQRQGVEGNSRHSDRNISCFLPGRAKDLSAPLYVGGVNG